ncbi:MAG: nickel-dependent lactate racemase [Promethearchaeota archaeon]
MKFDYGKNGIEINLDPSWNITTFFPKKLKIIENPVEAIKDTIKNPVGTFPLQKIIKQKKKINKICIVVSDATRPVPSKIILKALIKELNNYGIKDEQIIVLIANGLHRLSRKDELERILGKELKNRLKIIDHIATNKNHLEYLGISSSGTPIYINKYYSQSDLKIITGYVEPHFFFGFSGGRKSIVPGIAGKETIVDNHSAKNIASPYARFGIYKENPMHKNSTEIARKVGVDFTINVCINEKNKILRVAAGDLEIVHETLVNFQLKHIFKKIINPYDIVICGNGGYPLDLNLYQAVKSMAIGEMAVKQGGTIISVNELSDGVGQINFRNLIFSGKKPQEIYNKILAKEIVVPDQWEIQILTRILLKAEIYIVSRLNKEEIGNIGLKYAKNVEDAIKLALKKHGSNAKILILPNGPQILPLLKK